MPLTKVFWTHPYLSDLHTQVIWVLGAEVRVAETIFYAFSGGQESDTGTLGGWQVLAARKLAHDIIYRLDPQHNLIPGDSVMMHIDWPRRYQLMRLHFAAELVLELVYRRFNGIRKIGAHIAEDKARIDFSWPENLGSSLAGIQHEALELIKANLGILSAFSDEASERRYWEIAGFARVPCGGTHLRRTGEIGAIRLKRKNVGSNKERIEITLVT